jgi:restriction system protein
LLREMEWKRFELLVERYYAASGFRARSAGVGADDGVDIYLYRAHAQRPMSCVRCRSAGTRRVEVERVREFFGVMAAQNVPAGVLVTTGGFTADALTFGRQSGMTLLAGDEFIARFNRLPSMVRQRILAEITEGDYTTPSCPRCRGKLVLRLAPEDQSAFWACGRQPACHYTLRPQGEPDSRMA